MVGVEGNDIKEQLCGNPQFFRAGHFFLVCSLRVAKSLTAACGPVSRPSDTMSQVLVELRPTTLSRTGRQLSQTSSALAAAFQQHAQATSSSRSPEYPALRARTADRGEAQRVAVGPRMSGNAIGACPPPAYCHTVVGPIRSVISQQDINVSTTPNGNPDVLRIDAKVQLILSIEFEALEPARHAIVEITLNVIRPWVLARNRLRLTRWRHSGRHDGSGCSQSPTAIRSRSVACRLSVISAV